MRGEEHCQNFTVENVPLYEFLYEGGGKKKKHDLVEAK